MQIFDSKAWQWCRLILGVLLGGGAALLAAAMLPSDHAGLPTASATANLGHVVVFLQHVALLLLLYAVAMPLAFPALCARLVNALSAGLLISGVLLTFLYFRLGLQFASTDYFAHATMTRSVVSSAVLVLVTYVVGWSRNHLLERETPARLG